MCEELMLADTVKHWWRLILSPEKSFELPVYEEQMASVFVEFGTSKPKHRKTTYALNVLDFIDGSASESGETSDSSTSEDSMPESTTT